MITRLGLPPHAFDKIDHAPDPAFYAAPRLVTHIDARAIAAVTTLYGELLPCRGTLLDLMSSWVSHMPAEVAEAVVIGHGMNPEELAANPRLARWFVQDLNADPVLPLESGSIDGATLCVSVQYLQRPDEVLREVARVLRAGAPIAITFSNRCFPTKAVAIWTALSGADQAALVSLYLRESGFTDVSARELLTARGGDPLFAVTGRTSGAQPNGSVLASRAL